MADAVERPPCKVYKVKDGGTHWVCARTPAHAFDMLADSIDMTVEEYMREQGPEATELDPMDRVKIWMEFSTEKIAEAVYGPIIDGVDPVFQVDQVVNVGDLMKRGKYEIICSSEF